MKIKPLRDNLLVKQFKEEKISSGGLITGISESVKNKGVVINVGHSVSDIKIKDVVLFGTYAGSGIKDDDGTEFLIIKEEEIFAVIEGGK